MSARLGKLHVRDDEEPDVSGINWDAVDAMLRSHCYRCGHTDHLPADCPNVHPGLITKRTATRGRNDHD